MLAYSVLVIVLLFSVAVFYFIFQGFKSPNNPHKAPPEDDDFKVEEIDFPSIKGGRLYAWKVESHPDNPNLILVHGWGRNIQRMLPYLKNLSGKGFNLIAFDARGHGNSHKDGAITMLKFAEDIDTVIDYVMSDNRQKNKEINLLGLSIGGASSILAASRNNKINKVVTVGAFAHPLEIMRKQLSDRFVPYIPFTYMFFKYIKWRTKIDFYSIAPINNIAKMEAKVLLIHGILDKVVPLKHAWKLKEAQPKAILWEIPGRGHSDCHFEDGFWVKTMDFLRSK